MDGSDTEVGGGQHISMLTLHPLIIINFQRSKLSNSLDKLDCITELRQ